MGLLSASQRGELEIFIMLHSYSFHLNRKKQPLTALQLCPMARSALGSLGHLWAPRHSRASTQTAPGASWQGGETAGRRAEPSARRWLGPRGRTAMSHRSRVGAAQGEASHRVHPFSLQHPAGLQPSLGAHGAMRELLCGESILPLAVCPPPWPCQRRPCTRQRCGAVSGLPCA